MSSSKATQISSEDYYGIKIRRDGTWLHADAPIKRHNMVKLFATVLKKDETGDYWLETPYEKGRIEVEDVPFVAVEYRQTGAGAQQKLYFRTNLDVWVMLSNDHPMRLGHDEQSGASIPYILIKDNLEARINRAVYYALADLAVVDEDNNTYALWSDGALFKLGDIET